MSGWPRYPPCATGTCTDVVCCAHGHKLRWPELLGKNGAAAKTTIEKENPEVTAEILTPGKVGPPNFCCNRVFVIVDTHGNVTNIPTIG